MAERSVAETIMPNCLNCQSTCRGVKCRDCFLKKSRPSGISGTDDSSSSQDILSISDCKLISYPSFTNGLITDIEFVVPDEVSKVIDDTHGEDSETPTAAKNICLSKLVTGIFKREIDMLRKELEDVKNANILLNEEIVALKAERENPATVDPSVISTADQVNTVLAPYKEALEKISPMEKSLANHQRYLDHVDSKKREKNVVITGVKELSDDDDDATTVKEILDAAGCTDVAIEKVCRLGKPPESPDRNRPILVITDSVSTKKMILEKKSNLKNLAEDRFKKIYIKADEPLAVQREWKRLKDVYKKEKNAPNNVGTELKIDYKTRKLLRDGTVIDQFKSPFPKRGPNH